MSAAQLLYEFSTGTGETHQEFDQQDPFTMLLNKDNQMIRAVVRDFEAELQSKGMTASEYFEQKTDFKGGYEFSPDHAGFTESLNKHMKAMTNSIEFVIGGMSYTMLPMYDDQQKLAGYLIKFENTMGKNSLMLHRATDVPEGTGIPLANKTQTFTFGITLDEYEDAKEDK